MAYATQQQIENAAGGPARLKQIADWDNDGVVDAAAIAWAQLQADALINLHTHMRFASLVTSGGAVVESAQMLAAQECVYQLRMNRGQVSDEDTEQREVRMGIYRDIAEGKLRPADPAPAKSTTVGTGWVARETEDANGDPQVSRETLKWFW